MSRSTKIVCILVLLVLLSLYPFLAGKFHIYLLTECMIYSLFGVSFYLLLGHTGLLSFGHAAYFGVGAYATALCLHYHPSVPLPLALLLGAISGLVSGFLIGLMLLRLTKIYFSFATLSMGQMLWAIAWKWRSLTGGDDGLTGWSARVVTVPAVGAFSLSHVTFLYYLVFAVSTFCVLLCWYFTKTPLGSTLASIKSNANRTNFLGINIALAKLMLFSVAGMMAGVSGSLFILFKKMASPNFLDLFMSFDIVVISVIGGYTNFLGPIVGSFVHVYMVEYLSSWTDSWQLLMGGFFVLLILFFPGGLVGLFRTLSRKAALLMGSGRP
jgi:branched-chain amino acid transport system permease protein